MTPDEHLHQSAHNERLYDSIDREQYSDWAMTALFYAALHYVDAFLEENGPQPATHEIRDRKINQMPVLRRISGSYLNLKYLSENARYRGYCFSQDELNRVKETDLKKIKDQVKKYLRTKPGS